MSAFATIAQESADGQNTDAGVAVPEEETATAALSEATADAQDVAQEDADSEQLNDEQDELSDVEEVVAQESEGLTPQAAVMLGIALKNIVGKSHASKIIATENYSSSRGAQREAKQLALEGIKETLKRFWDAIKAQLKKFYNKVKSFFVKVFSAARKLGERAKKIQQKANDTVGTIEEKSFSFGQTKTIAVDGKYNEAGSLTTGLNLLRNVITKTVTELKKDTVDSKIEDLVTIIKAGFSGSGKTRSVGDISGLRTAVQKTIAGATPGTIASTVGDVTKYKAQFGDATDTEVKGVFGLPGSRAIIVVTYTGAQDTIESAVKALKGNKLLLAADKYNPRDVAEGDVKTLTTSQIDKVCDDVIDIAESVFTFEKNWKENDKFVEKVQKEVDDSIKDFDQEENADSTDQRHFRNFCNSAVGAIRRHTNFKANLCSYGVTTSNAFLNYAERSLAQHKAK